jgi:polysaccharide export outer membrane protein
MENAWEVVMKLLRLAIAGLSILALSLGGSAFAQTAESILIGPGDMLHVQVFDTPEMDQHARVTDDGTVPLIFLGNVHVAGLTPGAAARAIETQLQQKELMKHPQVTVSIEQYATQGVLVIGQVAHPGSYQIDTSRPVLDVISLAGGLSELANRKITIERHGTGERVQYIVSNDPEEAFDHSVLIHPGDKIMVPKAPIAYMLGDVNKPGAYSFSNSNKTQITVLQMLALAGGTPPTARPAVAKLIRRTADGYSETQIQLSDMQKGKIADIPMQSDDIVYVPYSYLKNIAMNAAQIVSAAGAASVYAVH